MNVSIFDNRRVRQGLTILFLLGSLTSIFPPKHPAFQWWAERAVFVALGLLFIGLFFLTLNKSRLMFVCLGCSAAICFFEIETQEKSVRQLTPPYLPPLDSSFQMRTRPDSFLFKPATSDESSKTSQ